MSGIMWALFTGAAPAVGLGAAAAQEVDFADGAEHAVDDRIRRLLRSGDFLLVTQDTLLSGSVSSQDVLILDATVYVEASIAGDLMAVAANVFLRPQARIQGDFVNLAGSSFLSPSARVDGAILDLPQANYRVERYPDRFRIVSSRAPIRLQPQGLAGLRLPRYDRVNGLSLSWGGVIAQNGFSKSETSLSGRVSYHSQRGTLDGAAEVEFHRSGVLFRAGGERLTWTNDHWILGELENTLDFLFFSRDTRDYFDAARWYVEISLPEAAGWLVGLRAQDEQARSLPAGAPWTLFGPPPRANPPIDDGRVRGVELHARRAWAGEAVGLLAGGMFEVAGAGGDFSFARFALGGVVVMDALFGHSLTVRWRCSGPLPGTEVLPGQRWGMVGGRGTFHTFPAGALRGDRLVFVESTYSVPPVGYLALPVLGPPALHLIHAVGSAWEYGEPNRLAQNLALRIGFGIADVVPYFRVSIDPAPKSPGVGERVELGLSLGPLLPPQSWGRRRN